MTKAKKALADRNRVMAIRYVSDLINFHAVPSEPLPGYRQIFGKPPKLSDFAFIDIDPAIMSYDDWYVMPDEKFSAAWPIDHSFILPIRPDDPKVDDSEDDGWTTTRRVDPNATGFRLAYCRSVKPKDVRTVANIFSPKMAFMGNMDFIDGVYDYGLALVSYVGGKWIYAMKSDRSHIFRGAGPLNELKQAMALHVGHALRYRYEWSIILHFPTCNVRFSVEPSSALQMFKDRNLEPFGNRRAPLLHWVLKHWRRKSASVPADLIEVKRHLRGRSDFTWRGFPVSIIPAEYDIEQVMARL